jgi:hypothetical protein
MDHDAGADLGNAAVRPGPDRDDDAGRFVSADDLVGDVLIAAVEMQVTAAETGPLDLDDRLAWPGAGSGKSRSSTRRRPRNTMPRITSS